MKQFTAIALAALMVMTVFASAATAATSADTVEIRSPVFTGATLAAQVPVVIDYTDFAGFYYDLDAGVGSEYMNITAATGDDIDDAGLVYSTDIQTVGYEFGDWDSADTTYEKIGFLAEEYIPVNSDPAILSKLILDTDDKFTLRTGQTLDLGEGFAITPKQIDVEGDKVWLELTKDGDFLDDEVVTVSGTTHPDNRTWDYEQDIAGEDDVKMLKVHVKEVFQGQVDSLAIIEGVWLMSDDAMEIETDDTFGELEVTSVTVAQETALPGLTLKNDGAIGLSADSTVDVTDEISIQVADDNTALRFYFVKEVTEPGTYEIRGSVQTGSAVWTAATFAGFYYDLDADVSSEYLNVTATGRTIADQDLVYSSDIQTVGYDFGDWDSADTTYEKIGFLAEEYIPVNSDPAILSKLILDTDDKFTLRTGQTLDLGEGFAITPKQIDVEGDKVWLELTKDGDFLDDEVITVSGTTHADNRTWDYEQDIAGEDDVKMLKIHVKEVFQGQVDSLAILEGAWLISDEAMEIETDDTYGELEVTSVTLADETASPGLTLKNDGAMTLTAGDDVKVTDEIYFKVADSAGLRYYPFVEYTIGGEVADDDDEEDMEEDTGDDMEEDTGDDMEEDTGDDMEEDTGDDMEEDTGDDMEEDTGEDMEEDTGEEEEDATPGFEAVFAIAGLLAVAYFVRRN